jgi:hypothetical protein
LETDPTSQFSESMDTLSIIKHLRDRPYMSGIDRDRLRVKETEEIFTPTVLVQESLTLFEQANPGCFADASKTFLDNCCGDGQFLSEVLVRKIENGHTFEQALTTIYGVDLMPDNVKLCQDRLLCGREDLRHIVERNIVNADALRYHYRFDGSHPYDDETQAQKKEDHLNNLFSFE